MEFEYDGVTTYNNAIDINNIHQVCLKAMDDKGFDYYLIIRTLLGECSTLEFGPLVEGDSILPDKTSINFERFDSDDYSIRKKIKNFLSPKNKGRNKIVNVVELGFNQTLDCGIDLLNYIRGFSKENNY